MTSARLTAEQFKALREKGLKVSSSTAPSRIPKGAKVSKARAYGKFPVVQKPEGLRTYNEFPIPVIESRAPQYGTANARDAHRLMTLDLSTKCVGVAWGTAGQKPEGTCSLAIPHGWDSNEEPAMLRSMADAVCFEARHRGCGFVIFSEFYHSATMLAFRANSSLRGAVMAELQRHGITALPVAEITARKAAGVDITKRREDEPKKGFMKGRVYKFFQEQGMDWPGDDEADAAVLLMGAKSVIEFSKEEPKQAKKELTQEERDAVIDAL